MLFSLPHLMKTYHMFDMNTLNVLKPGIKVVNVMVRLFASALIEGIKNLIASAALDVFEVEPFEELSIYNY